MLQVPMIIIAGIFASCTRPPDVIVRAGLTPGVQIITDGVQKAVPGMTVQVIPSEN